MTVRYCALYQRQLDTLCVRENIDRPYITFDRLHLLPHVRLAYLSNLYTIEGSSIPEVTKPPRGRSPNRDPSLIILSFVLTICDIRVRIDVPNYCNQRGGRGAVRLCARQ